MKHRLYFITYQKLAEIVHWISEDTIEDLVRRGEIPSIKMGRTVLIPTIELRKKYPQLSADFWEELTEDLYREWDGPTSARKRIERRRNGLSPTTGEPIDKTRNNLK